MWPIDNFIKCNWTLSSLFYSGSPGWGPEPPRPPLPGKSPGPALREARFKQPTAQRTGPFCPYGPCAWTRLRFPCSEFSARKPVGVILLCLFSVPHPRQRDPRQLLSQGAAGVLPSGGSPWPGHRPLPLHPLNTSSSPTWSSSLVLPRISLVEFTQVSSKSLKDLGSWSYPHFTASQTQEYTAGTNNTRVNNLTALKATG